MTLTATQQHFSKLYLASFKRAPDLEGLNYWTKEAESKSLQAIGGTIFFGLKSINAIYPEALSDAAFVEAIYQNVFGRASDAGGLAYWTSEIVKLRDTFTAQGSGNAVFEARGQLAMNMINAGLGAPDGAEGKAYIISRLNVVEYAVEKQLSTNVKVPPTELLAIQAGVNVDTSSKNVAMDAIDGWVYDIVAPTQTAVISAAIDDIGLVKVDILNNGTTDDANPELKGTLTAVLASGEKLVVYRDNQKIDEATVTALNWTFTDTTPGLGWHSYYVRVVDQAGNQGAVSDFFRINVEAPAVPVDTAPPVLQSAVVNGASLVLTYNEALNAASDAAANSYMVSVGGSPVVVKSVDANGSTVSLTLAAPVLNGQAVNISYTPPAISPIEDVAGNNAGAFSNQTVTNQTLPVQGGGAPELLSAYLNQEGYIISLIYSGYLDSLSEAAPINFGVSDGYRNIGVDIVKAGGNSVVLVLKDFIPSGSKLSVSYTPPSMNPIKGEDGNLVSGFSGVDVKLFGEYQDLTPPVLERAVINGNQISLTYSESLDPSFVPGQFNFEYRNNTTGEKYNAQWIGYDGSNIVLGFDREVSPGHDVDIMYQVFSSLPPFLQDFSGNLADFLYWHPLENVTGQATSGYTSNSYAASTGVDMQALVGGAEVVDQWF